MSGQSGQLSETQVRIKAMPSIAMTNLMMLAKLPLVTPSNSSGTGSDSVPLHTATGTITLSGRGMVVALLLLLQSINLALIRSAFLLLTLT